ncbi:uncharacterized protein LOC144363267 [Saccoglossus kowalevskii]
MDKFYSFELSRKLDSRHEFEKWRKDNLYHHKLPFQNGHQDKESSLLEFPFLLDPACKVHVLHLDAFVQMRQEYIDALLHQALRE